MLTYKCSHNWKQAVIMIVYLIIRVFCITALVAMEATGVTFCKTVGKNVILVITLLYNYWALMEDVNCMKRNKHN